MGPRLHVAAPPVREPVPLSPAADLIRCRLQERRQELQELSPRSIDLAAHVISLLHESQWGEATEHRGDRSPRYWRGQLAGEHGLDVADLCRLAVVDAQRSPAVRAGLIAALGAIAHELGEALEPMPEGTAEVAAEGADVARSSGRLTGLVLEATADGRIDPTEREAIQGELTRHKREIAELEAALAAADRGGQ